MNHSRSEVGLHGIVLSGGRSSRMGADKAMQLVDGVALVRRVAGAVGAVADPVLIVGPHRVPGCETVLDEGRGPLVALVTGWERLVSLGFSGPIFLAACDLPHLCTALIALLAGRLGTWDAAIPEQDSRAQPLAGCYAPAALTIARGLVAAGHDAMRDLVAALNVNLVPEADWGPETSPRALFDVDTPEALEAARRWAQSGAE